MQKLYGFLASICKENRLPSAQVVLLETRYVKAALSALTVKTDRKDARGLAQLIRMGWFRPVHAKSKLLFGVLLATAATTLYRASSWGR
jgi:hypothetical protein